MRKVLFVILLVLACFAKAEEWRIEVRNRSGARRNLVVSHVINKRLVELMKDNTLVEVLNDGKSVPVPCTVDPSGKDPVLVWLMSGLTDEDRCRTFQLAPKKSVAVLADGLNVTQDEKTIRIENRDYALSQPLSGGGGFPADITYLRSGFLDNELYFLDRIVRKTGDGGLQQFCARDCGSASAKLLFSSPLRAVVEVRTGFSGNPQKVPGHPRAVYRYTYTAFSPLVEVAADFTRDDRQMWRELHFMHLSRKECGPYREIITGAPFKKSPLRKKGDKSGHEMGSNWAVLSDGVNACGAGYSNVLFWDASDEFVYYIRPGHTSWESQDYHFNGALFFGSALDESVYDAWMGRDHQPEVTFFRNGKSTYPKEWAQIDGSYELEDSDIRIVFDSAEKGFDCIAIENRMEENVRFVNSSGGEAGFWELMFKTAPKDDGSCDEIVVNNRSAAECSVKQKRDELVFLWKGIDLPEEKAVVDVTAHLSLTERGESEWRLSVENRSKKFGLWHSDFPRLSMLTEPGTADMAVPKGNWGGSLYHKFNGSVTLPYPAHSCPVQCMSAFYGDIGLYIAAHDGKACSKELRIGSGQDVTFRCFAENAGVPGSSGAPDYPVVIASVKGGWWTMARRYRKWALQQRWTAKGSIRERSDYPKNLKDLSFWMIMSAKAEGALTTMKRAGELFPGLTIGSHWYNWHMIPFDNSYPEYFPTKPGVPEATKKMVGNGQVIMPYINGRLWDKDIDSFKAAASAACKKASGDIYVEHYGRNPRNLVPMCPVTDLWQKRVQEICRRLVDEVGVNSIYLDQIGAAKPQLCYDSSHGHPLGGGHHWVDGYRTMLTPIKEYCIKRGVSLTTENTAEPYMDNIDAYLTWNPRYETDIPLLPAIYSGYTVYFSSPQAGEDTLDAFCAAQGRDFLWGCQLGWNSDWILRENHRKKQSFQYELCRYRAAAKDFFLYGQLLGNLRFDNEVPCLKHIWHRNRAHCANLPVVMGTIWCAPDGRNAMFMVNVSSEDQEVCIDLSEQSCLKKRRAWKLQPLTPDGLKDEMKTTRGPLKLKMPPHSVWAFVM